MGFKVEVTGYDELMRALDSLERTLTREVTKACVKAAADVVAKRARQLCHRSSQTGTSKWWSDAYFSERAASRALADTIGVEVRDYGDKALALAGPEWDGDGKLAHNVENGHVEVLYGRRTGRQVPPHPFMRPAFDETQGEQAAAMEAVVAESLRELAL